MAVLYFLETWEGKDIGGRRVAEALLSTLGLSNDTSAYFVVFHIYFVVFMLFL